MAHFLQDEVPGRRCGLHQLADRCAGIGPADVRPEPDPGRNERPAAKGDAYLSSVANGWQQLVKSNGLTLFPDWASTNMLTVMETEFQKMIAQRETPADTAKKIQSEWTAFDKTLK